MGKPVTASGVTNAADAVAASERTRQHRATRHWPKSTFYGLIRSELRAYQERASLRGLTRIFGVSRNTVVSGSKKVQTLPPLASTLAPAQPQDALELDELWSFVGHRRRGVIWLWLALCRRTRQIVAYALGPRDDATTRLLGGTSRSLAVTVGFIPIIWRATTMFRLPTHITHGTPSGGSRTMSSVSTLRCASA